jgi:DNA (cytosine-5)-methyltransferase 1
MQVFDKQRIGQYGDGEVSSTLAARDYKDATDLVAYPIHDKATRHQGATGKGSGNGLGVGKDGDPSPTLTTGDRHAVAFAENQQADVYEMNVTNALAGNGGKPGQGYQAVREGLSVRRLTPTECERLQGFPDGYTQIPWRGKEPENCPDGPRYKALGNSMAVPVMSWIGQRIQAVEDL